MLLSLVFFGLDFVGFVVEGLILCGCYVVVVVGFYVGFGLVLCWYGWFQVGFVVVRFISCRCYVAAVGFMLDLAWILLVLWW